MGESHKQATVISDAGRLTLVKELLLLLGEDPEREGLKKTPHRFLKAMFELTEGYSQSPEEILSVTFTEEHADEMIIVKDIPFWSLCEHHLLPFTGKVTVGYIPQHGKIVGLSKIPRLVRCFAKRLQVQERLTYQIADSLNSFLDPTGVGVVVRGQHTCMQMRGVETQGDMVTSKMLGVFRTKPEARAEFVRLAGI